MMRSPDLSKVARTRLVYHKCVQWIPPNLAFALLRYLIDTIDRATTHGEHRVSIQ